VAPKSTVQFDWEPSLKEFHFRLSRFGENISDFSPLFLEIGQLFKQEMAATFVTQGGASGGEWEPLSPAYAAWKSKKFPGRGIGFLTGALMASMTGGPGYTEIITPLTVEFGEADDSPPTEYAKYFDEGTDKMPARPVLRYAPAWGVAWQRMTVDWVRGEAHHAGLMGAGSILYQQTLSGLSYDEPLPVD
jgi:hypothetical protein